MEKKISFLITHYNRFENLEICINAIRSSNIKFDYEIVISDDGSKKEIQDKILALNVDQKIMSPKNRGLAHNINKGMKACKGDFIFYCQDDFLINYESNFDEVFKEALFLLDSKVVDLVRFRANYIFPYLVPISKSVFRTNAFQYSDNPFLIRNDFFNNFGVYLEGTSPDYGEAEFAIRIFKSNARISIVNNGLIKDLEFSESVIRTNNGLKTKKTNKSIKRIKQYLRALRMHLEVVCYDPEKRGLITYKNKYKN
jgi:glycosyltransferase involved in cell wall biosynthesis